MKRILFLYLSIGLATCLFNYSIHLYKIAKPVRPYIILYDNPTEDDEARCRADHPNCMDVMDTSVLPKSEPK